MKYLILFILTFQVNSFAKESHKNEPYRIAIVDTGLDIDDPRFKDRVCAEGHQDFTGEGLVDTNGHGTFVAGLIQKYAGNGNYCFLIYKYYSSKNNGPTSLKNEIKAFQKAIQSGAKIINFSAGGNEFNEREYLIMKENPNVTFIVAAGNEGRNIQSEESAFYPASYFLNNQEVVGALNIHGYKLKSSNYANTSNFYWYPGEDLVSEDINGRKTSGSGTSYATAIRTGLKIKEHFNVSK